MKVCFAMTLALACLSCPLRILPPKPPPAPLVPSRLGPTEVWFAPDIGSTDLGRMFQQPELDSLKHLQVWKFYSQHVDGLPCDPCGPNSLPALAAAGAFKTLGAWGIKIAIEVPAIKPWGCSAVATLPLTEQAIAGVNSHGGRVAYLAMDEPLWSAVHTRCGLTAAEAATQVNLYVARIHAAHPEIVVGDIEPYPPLSAAVLTDWISGVNIQFFHLDPDFSDGRARLPGDLQALKAECGTKGIPFGVIFNGYPQPDAASYDARARATLAEVEMAIGTPANSIFQSWDCPDRCNVPPNLPAAGAYTLTKLILDLAP